MSKIDDVLYMFGDGREHGVGEVAKAVSLPRHKVRKVLGFLAEFNFIEYDRGRGRAKASPLGMKILSREKNRLNSPCFSSSRRATMRVPVKSVSAKKLD